MYSAIHFKPSFKIIRYTISTESDFHSIRSSGADINNGGEYTGNEKFEYLKSQGYDYYCNVDSNKYFVQMTDEYFRMGRRNVDGYRMYYNPDMLADLFDVSQVFDPSRPTPVPPMNGG